jgi:hypothetical protein
MAMTVEDHRGDCLDACEMRRQGLLDGGRYELDPGLRWPKLSELRIDRTGIALTYKSGRQQVFAISWTRYCRTGLRPWFVCDQCGQRAARLYYVFGDYRCKHCGRLVHECQSVSSTKRLRAKQAAIYRRLGYRHMPQQIKRLKWMRQRTFRKLYALERHLLNKLSDYRSKHIARPQWKGL